MTNPPADLVACQHYLHAQTGQPWDALGIIHGTPQGGGYHEGNDLLASASRLNTDYSKRESARDRPGTDAGSAFDIGDFAVTDPGGRRLTLRDLSAHIVGACRRGDPRTRDIREVIYTPDGATVRRWDRLGIRSSGDDSHLSHTHTSFFRDSEGRRAGGDNFLGLLRAYFEGDDMEQTDKLVHPTPNAPGRDVGSVLTDAGNLRDWLIGAGAAVPGDASWPKPDSPLGRLLTFLDHPPAPGTFTDAQAAAMADRIGAVVAGPVGELITEVRALNARLAAAGHALDTPA